MTNAVSSTNQPNYHGNFSIRYMQRTDTDCRFVAEAIVEARQREYIHATSKGSLETIRRVLTRNYEEQDDWYFNRTLVAEYNGEPVGILNMTFPEDPNPIESDYEMDFGCTDLCGLACLKCGLDETVKNQDVHINVVYGQKNYIKLGLLDALLSRAETEARQERKGNLFLYIPIGSPQRQLLVDLGYVVTDRKCCCMWCFMGYCGYFRMEKQLAPNQDVPARS